MGWDADVDRAGVITVIDHDMVSISNLHRQVLHTTERVGMNKAESAALAMKRSATFSSRTTLVKLIEKLESPRQGPIYRRSHLPLQRYYLIVEPRDGSRLHRPAVHPIPTLRYSRHALHTPRLGGCYLLSWPMGSLRWFHFTGEKEGMLSVYVAQDGECRWERPM